MKWFKGLFKEEPKEICIPKISLEDKFNAVRPEIVSMMEERCGPDCIFITNWFGQKVQKVTITITSFEVRDNLEIKYDELNLPKEELLDKIKKRLQEHK